MIKTILKIRLYLLFLVRLYKPKVKNRQKSYIELIKI